MGARKALCKPHLAFSETNLALLPGSAAHPVQNSPSKRPWQAHPVQNSPSEPQNADFGPPFACRENFLPLPPPTTRAGRTLSRMRGRFRYKTLPASGLVRPTRYKTLPASPKTPISAHFAPAGRTFYRFRHQQPEQGELYPACGAASGTKLSQQAALAGPPGTKLSQRAPKRRFRPILRQQGELCTVSATNTTSRANFIPHAEPLPVQNSPSTHPRRAQPVQNSPCRPARRPTRYRTLPARPARRPTRYKTLPASPKTPISAHFSHAGRTFYRFRHQHDEQGEKSHAPTLHRTPTTCRSPNFACNSIA